MQSLAFGMMGPGVSIATDLTEGVIDRFRTLPVPRSAYLIVGWQPHQDVLHVVGAFGLLIPLPDPHDGVATRRRRV